MHRDLNSVILEGGVVHHTVERDSDEKVTKVILTITSQRPFKDTDGRPTVEWSYFKVEVYGKIAVSAAKYGKCGKHLRVVGRLKLVNGEVVVVGEHIEYKPERDV